MGHQICNYYINENFQLQLRPRDYQYKAPRLFSGTPSIEKSKLEKAGAKSTETFDVDNVAEVKAASEMMRLSIQSSSGAICRGLTHIRPHITPHF